MSGVVKLGPTAVQKIIAPSYISTNISGDPMAAGYYIKDDYCVYHGKFYKCKSITYGAFDPTKWDETTVSENFGSGEDFTGATSSAAGIHGMVPAPAVGTQSYVLTADGTWKPAPGAKIQTMEFTVTNTSGAYDHTFEDDRVGADMKAILLEINHPYVFNDVITATPGAGTLRIQCADVCGTATVKVSIIKVVNDQEIVTSTEFTILNNRLNAIENVYSDTNITITPSDWTLSNDAYEYIWLSSKVTTNAAVEVNPLDGAEDSGIEDFDASKITGGVKFTSAVLPTGNLPVCIRVMAVKATDVQTITGEDVATDVIDGAVNVDEALADLDDRMTWKSWHDENYDAGSYSNEVSLPTNWNELYVLVNMVYSSVQTYPIIVVKSIAKDNDIYRTGFYVNSNDWGRFHFMYYSNKIRVTDAQINGSNYAYELRIGYR